jgi:hypothetical protein
MTATSASAGGADILVSEGGRWVSASVFAGVGSHVSTYVECVIGAGVASGWLHNAIDGTSDADGLQALSYADGTTIMWSYDSDSNIMTMIVTTEGVTIS